MVAEDAQASCPDAHTHARIHPVRACARSAVREAVRHNQCLPPLQCALLQQELQSFVREELAPVLTVNSELPGNATMV